MARLKVKNPETGEWFYADLAIQDDTTKESVSNKVTSLSSSSTDTEYPSAKAVYDFVESQGGGVPSGTADGQILVWDNTNQVWTVKPKWQMIYQPVEYIESTGTQVIDTLVPITVDLRMVLERANVTAGECIEGAIMSSNPKSSFTWAVNGATNNNFGSLVGSDTSVWTNSGVPVDTNKHTVDLASGSQKLDGVEYGTQTIAAHSVTVGLFGWKTPNGWQIKYPARVYSCKFYNGNTLIRDYIPVYNVFNGEAGLFDKVNNKFYGNQGTGTFTKGADVN